MADVYYFSGAIRMPDFRCARLLQRLQSIDPELSRVRAQALYFAISEQPLASDERMRLCALLDAHEIRSADHGKAHHGAHFIVIPRFERGVEYTLESETEGIQYGNAESCPDQRRMAIEAVLHDPMTETVIHDLHS